MNWYDLEPRYPIDDLYDAARAVVRAWGGDDSEMKRLILPHTHLTDIPSAEYPLYIARFRRAVRQKDAP